MPSSFKQFSDFEHLHRGQSILVCGLGESLNLLKDPENYLTIGVNDIGRKFHPTYLLNVNLKQQYKGDRWQHIESTRAKVIFTHIPNHQPAGKPVVTFKLGKVADVEIADGKLPHYRNSPYVAVCLAAYMGARKIGLLGVDFTQNHFWVKDGPHRLERELAQIDQQYGKLSKYLVDRGARIVNLSPISRLTSIPKERLEDFGKPETEYCVDRLVGA